MKTLLISFIFCCCLFNSSAQNFEIRATKGTDNRSILVQVRATGVFTPSVSNRVQDLIFGIKWLKSCGNNLDLTNFTNYGFNIVTAGSRDVNDLYHYRPFGADPTNFTLPNNWLNGDWVTIYSVMTNSQGVGNCDFEICELGFDNALSNQTGPNINFDFTDYTPSVNGRATNVVLPVTLLDFGVVKEGQTARLFWKVESEQSVQDYTVERAAGQALKFEAVGTVQAAKQAHYQWLDKTIANESAYYYRLKINDLDGNFQFSKTVFLEQNGKGIKISRNTEGGIFIETDDRIEQITLTNALGQVVKTGQNNTLPLDNLPTGIYIVSVKTNRASVSQKVFKN